MKNYVIGGAVAASIIFMGYAIASIAEFLVLDLFLKTL